MVTTMNSSQIQPIERTNTLAAVDTGSMLLLLVPTNRLKNSPIIVDGRAFGAKSSWRTAKPTAV